MIYILMILQVMSTGSVVPALAVTPTLVQITGVSEEVFVVRGRAETIDSFERAAIAPWTTAGYAWGIRDTTNTYGPNDVADNGYRYAGVPNTDIATYPNGEASGTLTSPTYDMTGWDSLFFSFAFWADVEGVTDNFDGTIVEISSDNGTNWKQIDHLAVGELNPTYDARLANTGPLGDSFAYCYDHQAWVKVATPDLMALGYAAPGNQVRFRFTFAKDPLAGGQGFFVDDVRVADAPPVDQQPPVIDHTPIADNPDTLSPTTVSAIVTDGGSGVDPDSVYLHYQVETGPWNHVQMSLIGGDTYEGLVPTQTYHTDIFYNISAADLAALPNEGVTPTFNFEVTNARTIVLDDSQPYYGGTVLPGSGFFNQFPLSWVGLDSGWLHQVKFFFDGPGSFDLRVYDWTGSMPGTLLDSLAWLHCPDYLWYTVDVTDLNIHTQSEVVVGFIAQPDPDSIFCMWDPAVDYPNRSWEWDGFNWSNPGSNAGELMCRIKVIPLPLTGVTENENQTKAPRFALAPAVPSVGKGIVRLSYRLDREQSVSLELFDAAGRRVNTLVNGTEPAGEHSIVWNGADENGKIVSSGVYFVKLTGENQTAKGKLILSR